MSKLSSAPVRWTMGQALLPAHFEALESSLRGELWARMSRLGLPRHGVARLKWDPALVDRGVVRITDLTLVLPGGALVDVPGNCEPVSHDLGQAAESRVSLHLAVMDPGPPGPATPGKVDRAIHRAALTSSRTSHPEAETFHLADLVRDADGHWSLAEDFLPPCLGVKENPFHRPWLERFADNVERFHRVLLEDIRDNYLEGHRVMSARQALRRVYELKGFLADVASAIDPHPYELFSALRSLYVEVAVYQEAAPAALDTAFVHHDAAPGVTRLLEATEVLIERDRARAAYVAFEKREGTLVTAIPSEARRASHVFLLAQKGSVGQRIELGRVKMASPTRLPIVHRRALRGIPTERIDDPPFHHDFSAEVEIWRLARGEEWDHAVNEGAVAAYEQAGLENVQLFLYWR